MTSSESNGGLIERALARFAAGLDLADIPAAVVHEGRRSLVNIVATGFAGCREPAIDKALRVLSPHSRDGDVALVGRPERVDLLLAAFLNAMAANIHDFDDTHPATVIHPSAPVAPALAALAQTCKTSGRALLAAFVAGAEAECRIGNAVSPSHYARGWHITSTCGAFGSAFGAAALLGLDAEAAGWAIANAAAQSAGLVQTLGTMAKSLGVGGAARNGLVAALLAREGFSGPDDALTGARGFLRLYCDDPPDLEAITRGLGSEWTFATNTYKPYPVGVVLNAVIDAALDLRRQGLSDPSRIRAVTVRAHPLLRERTDRPDVDSGRLAQVSLQHALAIVLMRGQAGLEELSDAAVAATRGRRPPVTFVDEPQRDIYSLAMRVELADGGTLETEIAAARGSAANPMRDEDLSDKLRRHAEAAGFPRDRIDGLLDGLWRIDTLDDCGPLFASCGLSVIPAKAGIQCTS
jgi:2-methylcitrate dehydratase PrpD